MQDGKENVVVEQSATTNNESPATTVVATPNTTNRKTRKIESINIVKNGGLMIKYDDGKLSFLDQAAIQTALLMGITLKSGSSLMTEDSVNILTSEVSTVYVKLSF